MTDTVEKLSTWLVTDAKAKDKDALSVKEVSLMDVLKTPAVDKNAGLTCAALEKAKRLADLQLVRENMEAICALKGWTEAVTTVFPNATFRVEQGICNRIVIEVD